MKRANKPNKPFDLLVGGRITLVLLFFFALFLIVLGRLFSLQVVNHQKYSEAASRQHDFKEEVSPARGRILAQTRDGELVPLALERTFKVLSASPKDVEDPEEAASRVAEYFNTPRDEILARLQKKDDPYEVLLKGIELEEAEKFSSLKIKGLFFEGEKKRVYPHGQVAAHLVGFVSREKAEEEGRYGLEQFFERELAGKKGFFEGVRDAAGFWVALGKRIINPSQNGSDVVLSVDYNIQLKSEEVLDALWKKWEGTLASVLVVEPRTGRILAFAARPSHDPNLYFKENDFSVFVNPAAQHIYELGSVLKPITMAGALEERIVTPETTYYDEGEVRIGGRVIKNFDLKSYKTQTMTQVLEKSLNTGAVWVANRLGKEKQRRYLELFGFGQKTGVDLPGELAGNISNLDAGRDIDFATASFGQGIAVTPLQLAFAFAAIANDGELPKPLIADRIIDTSGGEFTNSPEMARRVISPETSEKLTKMLISVVRNGFENRAGVEGYFVAGKTGTAQVPKEGGAGYSDRVIHSFVGYAPAFDPRFLIYIQLNKPRGNRFAANTLTPAFHDLAEYILNYYEIPPDEK